MSRGQAVKLDRETIRRDHINSLEFYENKPHPRYPLIRLVTEKGTDKSGCKWSRRNVERSHAYDKRWYARYLPFLYARQVALAGNYLWTHKGKSLMELPFTVSNVYDTEEIENIYDSFTININTSEGYATKKNYKSSIIEIGSDEIIQAELDEEENAK